MENDPHLIMVDDKENSPETVKMIIERVKEWSYAKGASAVLLYGNKGKNGVLVVRTQ